MKNWRSNFGVKESMRWGRSCTRAQNRIPLTKKRRWFLSLLHTHKESLSSHFRLWSCLLMLLFRLKKKGSLTLLSNSWSENKTVTLNTLENWRSKSVRLQIYVSHFYGYFPKRVYGLITFLVLLLGRIELHLKHFCWLNVGG